MSWSFAPLLTLNSFLLSWTGGRGTDTKTTAGLKAIDMVPGRPVAVDWTPGGDVYLLETQVIGVSECSSRNGTTEQR